MGILTGNPGSVRGWEMWQTSLYAKPAEAVPDDLPGRWWVLHTRPRNEKALALELRARNLFHYLPLCLRSTRAKDSGRISRSLVPVFPGYLFINGNDTQRQQSLMTNRVSQVLPVIDQGELIHELRHIQRLLISDTEFRCEPKIEVGKWARVLAGPLEGLEGIVTKHMSRMRLAMNVRMLSQSVVVEVARELLEHIDGPSSPD